jgi:methionine biosynthesis protein metW
MLNIAQFKKQNLNEKLSYEDEYFDYVILTEVIEHLENPNDLLKEIHRVLKSG